MPRLISAGQLREYLGVNPSRLARMRRAGTIPAPLPHSRLYDFEAVKRALDNQSAPSTSIAPAENRLLAKVRAWRKAA
jgi:hypothetical protein